MQTLRESEAVNLEYKGYKGSVHVLPSGRYCGKILGVKDSVNYSSITREGLILSFIDAVDDYLDTCKQLGKEPQWLTHK